MLSSSNRKGMWSGVLGLSLLIVLGLTLAAGATTRNVPSTYATIQAAINASVAGDVVVVDSGTYTEAINFSGKAITVRSLRGSHVTTITNNSTTDLVVFSSGEGFGSVLQGFTLYGGRIAIWCKNSSPMIKYCVMRNQNITNWAAVVLSGLTWGSTGTSRPTIVNCIIRKSANGGISMFTTGGPTVKACVIDSNGNYGMHLVTAGNSLNVSYNDVWGNPTNYINISNPGTGSFSSTPLYVDDFNLGKGSPCIDAGEPSAVYNDVDGTRNDIGAHPLHQARSTYSIQSAITNAAIGDRVMTWPGTYTENIDFGGKQLVVTSRGGRDSTTIHALSTTVAVVKIVTYEPRGTEISGFTIEGSNRAGIRLDYSSARVLNNYIQKNKSGSTNEGAGIEMNNTSRSVIKGNVIRWDTANTYGAGIHGEYSSNDTICYNLLYKNYGYGEIRMLSSNTAIYNNSIDAYGSRYGGISNQNGGTLDCRNNIVNRATAYGVYAANGGYAVLNYSDNNLCAMGAYGGAGITVGVGNFSWDPGWWGIPAGDPAAYDLTILSDCIDAGDPDAFFYDWCDGTRNDLGWKPYCAAPAKLMTDDGSAGNSALPNSYALGQNFPNPFNPTTKIEFTLPSAQGVRLEIFNILGQRIKTLADDQFGAGTHTVEWNATDQGGNRVASGVYFYRLAAGDFVQSKKMLLLK